MRRGSLMWAAAVALSLLGGAGAVPVVWARQDGDEKPPVIIAVPKNKKSADPAPKPEERPPQPRVRPSQRPPSEQPIESLGGPDASEPAPRSPSPRTPAPAERSPLDPRAGSEPGPQARGGGPAAPDRAPAALTERLVSRKIGSDKMKALLDQIESARSAADGLGAPSASTFWDRARPRTGSDDAVRASGTQFFSGRVQPATVQDVQRTVRTYGSIPGGVVLEGSAKGLGRINTVSYDTRFNALIFDDRAAFFLRIPPKTLAAFCRAIAQDDQERVGVSLGETPIVYGKVDPDSDLAWDLKLADHFLGDIVFVYRNKADHWTQGYTFAQGYKPEAYRGTGSYHAAVFFKFNGFDFKVDQEEVVLSKANLDVQLIPLSEKKSENGGLLPDPEAITRGDLPDAWRHNAAHVAENVSYYRRERIVDRTFAYGEVAALLRALKEEGFDLEALAARIPRGK